MKQKKMIIALLIITLLISGSVVLINTVSAPADPMQGNRPILKVALTSKVAHIDGDPVDTWLYVTNPSRSLDRLYLLPDPPYTEILHPFTINYFQMNVIDTDGTEYFDEFYPPVGEPQEWDDYRWDAVVNPGEKSLVFYVGHVWLSDIGSTPGVAYMTYLLNCEYEGLEYNLEYRFNIIVRP